MSKTHQYFVSHSDPKRTNNSPFYIASNKSKKKRKEKEGKIEKKKEKS